MFWNLECCSKKLGFRTHSSKLVRDTLFSILLVLDLGGWTRASNRSHYLALYANHQYEANLPRPVPCFFLGFVEFSVSTATHQLFYDLSLPLACIVLFEMEPQPIECFEQRQIQQICFLLSAFSFWLLGKVHCQCGAKLHETQRLWSMVKHSMFDKKTKKTKKTSLRPSLLALPSGLGDLASGGWTDRGWHWTGLSWMDPFWTHGHLYGCQHPRARVAGWSIRRTMLSAHDTINVSKSSSGIQWISIQLPTNLSAFIEMVTGLAWPVSDYVSFVSLLG